MPGAAEAGLTDEQLPLDQLANRIDLAVRSQNKIINAFIGENNHMH